MEGDSDDDAQVDLMSEAQNLADLKNAFKSKQKFKFVTKIWYFSQFGVNTNGGRA